MQPVFHTQWRYCCNVLGHDINDACSCSVDLVRSCNSFDAMWYLPHPPPILLHGLRLHAQRIIMDSLECRDVLELDSTRTGGDKFEEGSFYEIRGSCVTFKPQLLPNVSGTQRAAAKFVSMSVKMNANIPTTNIYCDFHAKFTYERAYSRWLVEQIQQMMKIKMRRCILTPASS